MPPKPAFGCLMKLQLHQRQENRSEGDTSVAEHHHHCGQLGDGIRISIKKLMSLYVYRNRAGKLGTYIAASNHGGNKIAISQANMLQR